MSDWRMILLAIFLCGCFCIIGIDDGKRRADRWYATHPVEVYYQPATPIAPSNDTTQRVMEQSQQAQLVIKDVYAADVGPCTISQYSYAWHVKGNCANEWIIVDKDGKVTMSVIEGKP